MTGLVIALLIAVPVLFVAVFGVIATVIVRGRRGDRDRIGSMAEQARSRGWRFTPAPTGEQRAFWGLGTGLLANRDSKLVEFERQGLRVAAWEHVEPGDENTSAQISHHVVIALPRELPRLRLVPEAVAAASLWRGRDIQFESEAFNGVWRVSSESDRFAHAVVHPQMMQFLLRPDVMRRSFELRGHLARTGGGGALSFDVAEQEADVLATLVHLIPRQVWDDAGS